MSDTAYIEVILPQPLPKLYTYSVPRDLRAGVVPGKRVEVQFGKRRIYAALVHAFVPQPEAVSQIKPILSVLDSEPIVTPLQFEFWHWLAEYYMCTYGDVMQAALPSAFKLSSESIFCRYPGTEWNGEDLTEDEYLIAEAFEFREELTLSEIQQIVNKKSVIGLIKDLIAKHILYIREELVEKYQPRMESFVELEDEWQSDDSLRHLLDELNRAPKQLSLVLAYLDKKINGELPVRRPDLLSKAEASSASLNGLVTKGVFRIVEMEVERISEEENELRKNVLGEAQAVALDSIKKELQTKPVTLLYGETASGKTHIYVELIRDAVESGKQVLYLLPEIALTDQLIRRLRNWLGDVGIYHSKFNDAERVEIWHKVLDGRYKVVVGARSAVFLPFRSLGLIIVDEEQDSSFKQYDPAPRYNGRDSAVFLANLHKAQVIMGSATPAYESFYHSNSGKYGKVELKRRYSDSLPPEILLADLSIARKRREMNGALTPMLQEAIDETLKENGQVILFQNRRGYAPYLACHECNWIPKCRNCDVSLTYHKFTDDLRCHYCGYREAPVSKCRSCGTPHLELRGMGTERIEDDLKVMYPAATVARMDFDAVRTKHGHERIIHRLESGDIDILVGTQMVTKGLDFERVRLVGVLNADALLYYPDFRSAERAFQLLKQVSGRAGRKNERGKVIIQVSDPQHPVITQLLSGNGYEDLFRFEMKERKDFLYPPYVRMIRIIVKHKDARLAEKGCRHLGDLLRKQWGSRVLGPVKPLIGRIKTLYIRELTIKIERNSKVIHKIKDSVFSAVDELNQYQEYRALRIYADVDPY